MNITTIKKLIAMICMMTSLQCDAQQINCKSIKKNDLSVSWYYNEDRIFFEMSAPTNGWLAIGFNSKESIEGTYLIMGNVIKDKANVVEHYTISPGNYKPLTDLNMTVQIKDIQGIEKDNTTKLKFSLPIESFSKYQRPLSKDTAYVLWLAYSQEDDFQHHSMMRTFVNITL